MSIWRSMNTILLAYSCENQTDKCHRQFGDRTDWSKWFGWWWCTMWSVDATCVYCVVVLLVVSRKLCLRLMFMLPPFGLWFWFLFRLFFFSYRCRVSFSFLSPLLFGGACPLCWFTNVWEYCNNDIIELNAPLMSYCIQLNVMLKGGVFLLILMWLHLNAIRINTDLFDYAIVICAFVTDMTLHRFTLKEKQKGLFLFICGTHKPARTGAAYNDLPEL